MKKFLVGYTGFVGSNICNRENFDGLFNSQNIAEAFNGNPDILIYAGIPAQKFLANKNEQADMEIIENAISNIQKINPKKLILISTIDIYDKPINVDENSTILVSKEAYGKNRYYLEEWVKNNISDYLIVRLPGLFGKNIKKNFIYDLINYIPNMLSNEKYEELISKDDYIKDYYHLQENGFYKCQELTIDEKEKLKLYFKKIGFSALNFTDSRGSFQFYNLNNLWRDINIAINNNIKIINLATEPVTISEIYKYIFDKEFINEISDNIPNYNFKTLYYKLYNGKNGYIYSKDNILKDIKEFVMKNN